MTPGVQHGATAQCARLSSARARGSQTGLNWRVPRGQYECSSLIRTGSSLGGRSHQAQRAVIQQLACIFDFYHRGEESDLQTLKAEFVKAALDAAQIPSPRFAASEARSASRSRLVRLLPKPCPACRARGRSERLASDWVWERIQACAARVQTEALQTENKELTLERAVAEVLKTREGQQLYDAGVKLFAVPEKAARGSAEVRLVLANAGIRLEEQPRTRLRDDGAEEVPK